VFLLISLHSFLNTSFFYSKISPFTSSSRPIHPATVHFPLTFLVTSGTLDVFTFLCRRFPSIFLPPLTYLFVSPNSLSDGARLGDISTFSYVSTILALVTSIPAIISGATEAWAIFSTKGLDFNNPVVKTVVIHAGLNYLAVFGAVYNWFTRRGNNSFLPGNANVAVSVVMLVSVLYSGYLGGGLVYERGIAVQRMGKGKKEKERDTKAH
jgi:uncharacterized membrane protein